MKKTLLAIILTLSYYASHSQSSFTQSFTTTGTVVSPVSSAQICPTSGQTVTFKANAAWPFGTDGDLIIGAGQTVQIPCGSVKDYDSINIAAGGKLEIMDGTGWTVIGCRRGFVLNGTIEGRRGTHSGGTFSMNEPDENGNMTGTPLSYSIVQKNGGNGGYGGSSREQQFCNCGSSFAAGGLQSNGNGGGGGAGGGSNEYNPANGSPGGNANSTNGGSGGSGWCVANGGATVGLYSTNGNNGGNAFIGDCGSGQKTNGGGGGSGATRGKHGHLLYLFANKSIQGTGTIDLRGMNGGTGGNGGQAGAMNGCGATWYSASGGGGGGGAGGSGGYLMLKHFSSAPTISVLTSGGNGGSGGISNGPLASCYLGGSGDSGQNGDAGSTLIQSIPGSYSFQWRRNGTNIAGATNYSHTDNIAGTYDCRITKPDLSTVFTSGSFALDRDTIYVDATPIAAITSVNPGNNQICFGDTATLTAQLVQGQTYQWVHNGTPIIGANSHIYQTTVAGTYFVAANNTCNAPEVSSTVAITVNNLPSQPVITLTGNDTICEGQSVALQSNVASNIEWNTGETTQTITVSQTGDYYVTVTNGNGCQNTSDTIHIEVKPASVDLGADVNLTCGFTHQFNPVLNPSSVTSYSWTPNTGFSCTNCPNPIFAPGQGTVNYTLDVVFANGCSASDNVNVTTETGIAPEICLVTVDTSSTKNEIVWEKPIATQIDSFRIYRKAGFNYLHIASVHYDSLSSYIDDQAGVNPNSISYQYAISAIDACGNESPLSDSAITMHVLPPNVSGNDISLDWSDYVGFTGSFYYRIMRDSAGINDWRAIDSTVAGVTAKTDFNALNEGSLLRYRIEIITQTPCVATRAVNHNVTRSNRSNGIVGNSSGISENIPAVFQVFPNPNNGTFRVESAMDLNQCRLIISDINGKQVFDQTMNTNSTVQLQLSPGIYLAQIQSYKHNFRVVKLVITE